MKQREIYLAKLDPIEGSEQGGVRPVVVISGNSMNDNLKVGIVCPISSTIKNYAGCHILKKSKLNGLKTDSEVITFQVRTISESRLLKKLGSIIDDDFKNILTGLIDILHY